MPFYDLEGRNVRLPDGTYVPLRELADITLAIAEEIITQFRDGRGANAEVITDRIIRRMMKGAE